MDLYALQVFQTVVAERSFSRAAEKLFRTQPAISLAVQRLESDVGEKLLDRSQKELRLTDAGRTVLDHAGRLEDARRGLEDALADMRGQSAGRLSIGANESSILYLLPHLERFRRLVPKIKVQARRSQSSKIPAELLHGDLELGVVSYDPGDDQLVSKVIFTDPLTFGVSPAHRLARRKSVTIGELGQETFIAHNVVSPYRAAELREFRRPQVPLNMHVEMPTLDTIRRVVQATESVSFLPLLC